MKNSMNFIIVILAVFSIHLITENVAEADSPFHMMPLGSHIKSTSIEEVTMDNMITPELFAKDYLLPQKPLVLREVAKQWPAFTKWTDEYLNNNYGKLEVRLEGRKEKLTDMPPQGDICLGRDSISHFINTYHVKDVNKYIMSELPEPLYKYVKVPPPLGCGDLSKGLVEVDLWMSSGGAQSMLHKHYLNTVTCVVNGTKEWKIVESKYNHLLYQVQKWDDGEKANTDYSLVNPENVDLKKFPKIAKIPEWLFASLNAGDCLYLPSESWHTVNSQGDKNVAVGFLFQNFQDMNLLKLADCANEPKALPLEEVDPDWRYRGDGLMSMGNSPFSYYLDVMDSFFGKRNNDLKYDNVYQTLLHLMSYLPYAEIHVDQRAKDLFEKLSDLSRDTVYTLDMLSSLSRDQLRDFINDYIQPPVPANSCDHEYSYFSPEEVSPLFENVALQNGGVVRKEKFVEAYVNMGGHVNIATYMWKRFAHKKTKVKFDIYKVRVDKAVEKFYLFWRSERESSSMTMDAPEVEGAEPDSLNSEEGDDSSEQVPKDEL